MIRKLTHIMALFFVVFACVLYLPGECEHPNTSFFGSIVQPFAASPQYDVSESPARQQMSVDQRVGGVGDYPSGGSGLMWTWHF
ncbi:exported hypothetical protein [Syntrophobacter sp. SbD1]|nr:exported hypothetical protein [Syntrophobacter sp. SbD1]